MTPISKVQKIMDTTALLRLSIQVLCKELGGNEGNINTDIAKLVKRDYRNCTAVPGYCPVTGNDTVHPGQIDNKRRTCL